MTSAAAAVEKFKAARASLTQLKLINHARMRYLYSKYIQYANPLVPIEFCLVLIISGVKTQSERIVREAHHLVNKVTQRPPCPGFVGMKLGFGE